MATTTNIPAIITTVGGPLERVVKNIESYTDSNYPMSRQNQMALARIVEVRPDLNNEHDLGLLIDALTYHGVGQYGKEFLKLVDTYGIEMAHLAVDYLYEVGERDRGRQHKDTQPTIYNTIRTGWQMRSGVRTMERVIKLVARVNALGEDYGVTIGNVEELDTFVGNLTVDDIDDVLDLADEDIVSCFTNYYL